MRPQQPKTARAAIFCATRPLLCDSFLSTRMNAARRPTPHRSPVYYALDAHHRVSIGCLVALAAAFLLHGHVRTPLLLVLTWEAFALTSMVMAWFIIYTKDPYEARRNARLQDASATFLFVQRPVLLESSAVEFLLQESTDLTEPLVISHQSQGFTEANTAHEISTWCRSTGNA